MPLPSDVSDEEFKQRGYMVEVFWFSSWHDGAFGVRIVQSTPQSNRLKDYRRMGVYWMPQCDPECILGSQNANYRGSVLDVYPPKTLMKATTIIECILAHDSHIYHAWAGYSLATHIVDGHHHCLDWYVQSPERLMTGWYVHYHLLDAKEPSEYYEGSLVQYVGMRQMPDTKRYENIRYVP